MIRNLHRAYVIFLRSLSVSAPGLKVTCIGGDAAREMEMVVRDTCRRQWFLFGDDTNRYAIDDVRWWWWEDEAEIMRGEKLADVVPFPIPPAPVPEEEQGDDGEPEELPAAAKQLVNRECEHVHI